MTLNSFQNSNLVKKQYANGINLLRRISTHIPKEYVMFIARK